MGIQDGQKICMNHSSLLYFFLLSGQSRGNLRVAPNFWKWRSHCVECSRSTRVLQDLFCRNFASSQRGSKVCQQSWCSNCYKSDMGLNFKLAGPENDEGRKWEKKMDVARNARPGDMLLSPFQCDDCWFWNVRKRRPDRSNPTDTTLLWLIRRANLDVKRSRESSTVTGTLQDLLATARIQVDLCILPTCADQGPWPVGDFTGMGVAVAMLRKSLDSG